MKYSVTEDQDTVFSNFTPRIRGILREFSSISRGVNS